MTFEEDKIKIVKCMDILSENNDHKTTIGLACMVLVHIVDVGKRKKPNIPKSVSLQIQTDALSSPYKINVKQIEKLEVVK